MSHKVDVMNYIVKSLPKTLQKMSELHMSEKITSDIRNVEIDINNSYNVSVAGSNVVIRCFHDNLTQWKIDISKRNFGSPMALVYSHLIMCPPNFDTVEVVSVDFDDNYSSDPKFKYPLPADLYFQQSLLEHLPDFEHTESALAEISKVQMKNHKVDGNFFFSIQVFSDSITKENSFYNINQNDLDNMLVIALDTME